MNHQVMIGRRVVNKASNSARSGRVNDRERKALKRAERERLRLALRREFK